MISGDSLSYHKDRQFRTKDADHDSYGNDCSTTYLGAWWYYSYSCLYSNLNGHYYRENENPPRAKGVVWKDWKGYYGSLKRVSMKVRATGFTPGKTLHFTTDFGLD